MTNTTYCAEDIAAITIERNPLGIWFVRHEGSGVHTILDNTGGRIQPSEATLTAFIGAVISEEPRVTGSVRDEVARNRIVIRRVTQQKCEIMNQMINDANHPLVRAAKTILSCDFDNEVILAVLLIKAPSQVLSDQNAVMRLVWESYEKEFTNA